MSLAVERLVAERRDLLADGEQIVAAGRARTVAGTESADLFPSATIWAVSETRLFVFDARFKSRHGLADPLVTFVVAETVTSTHVEPFDDRDTLLVVDALGHPAIVVMDPDDAQSIVDAIRRALAASTEHPRHLPDPPGTRPSHRLSPDPVTWGVFAGRDAIDLPTGDHRIEAMRAACTRGEWEPVNDMFTRAQGTAVREWLVRHLGGDELVEGLERWVAAQPDSPSAYLARGANTVWTAFTRRAAIGDEAFWDELRRAERDLFWSVELDFDDPVAFTPLIRSALGLQVPLEELCVRFDESVRRDASLVGVHVETLLALGPLGAGTTMEMLAFAGAVASTVAEGSPLHVVVPLAHLVGADRDPDSPRRTRSLSSEAIGDIELAAAMSIDSTSWVPVPAQVEILNIFAAAFARAGDRTRAAEVWHRATGLRTWLPWSLLSDGVDLYGSLVAVES